MNTIQYVSAIITSALLSLNCPADSVCSSPDPAVLDVIENAYTSNVTAFPHGACRFTYQVGSVSDPEHARMGKLIRAFEAQGACVYDEANGLYVREFQEKDLLANAVERPGGRPSEYATSSPFTSVRLLTNGRDTFFDVYAPAPKTNKVARKHVILSDPDLFYMQAVLPLSIHGQHQSAVAVSLSLSRDIKQSKVEGSNVLLERMGPLKPSSREAAANLFELVFSMKNGKRTYLVDLDKSSVPILIRDDLKSGKVQHVYYDDIRYIARKGWLPHRQVIHLPSNSVHVIKLLDCDFEHKPPPSAYVMELSGPTRVRHERLGVNLAKKRTIGLSDLSPRIGPGKGGMAGNQAVEIRPDPMPGEGTSTSRWQIAAGSILVMAMGAYFFSRLLRRGR